MFYYLFASTIRFWTFRFFIRVGRIQTRNSSIFFEALKVWKFLICIIFTFGVLNLSAMEKVTINFNQIIGIQKIIATIKIIIATTPKNYCDHEKKLLRPSKKLLRPSKKLLRLRKKIIATMQKNYCDLPRKCCDLPKNYCDLPKNYCDHPKFSHFNLLYYLLRRNFF